MTVRTIPIELNGLWASVAAADAATVTPWLVEARITFNANTNGVQGQSTSESLAHLEEGRLRFPSKLGVWVAAHLQHAGLQPELVRVLGQRMIGRLNPPSGAIGASTRDLLATTSELGALVRFGGDHHPHRIVPELLAAFAASRAVVAAANRRQIAGWVTALRAALPSRSVSDSASRLFRCAARHQILVTSLQHLDLCRPDDFDFAIVPDVRPILRIDGRPAVEHGPPPRLDYRLLRHWHVPAYGFLAASIPLTLHEERRLWTLFGRTYAPQSSRPAKVRVTEFVPPRPATLVPDPDDDLHSYKQSAVWTNSRRNYAIIKHIRQRQQERPTQRIAILVENRRHAQLLAALLPDWTVRSGDDSHLGAAAQPLDRVIATEVWAAAQRPLDMDVLVDVRGWGVLDLQSFPPRAADDRTVELIDFADRVPYSAARQARRRIADYRSRGWEIARAPNSHCESRTRSAR